MHHAITIFLSNRILEAFCRYTKSSTFLTFHPVTPILWKLNICQVFSVSGRNEIWTFTYTWHLSHVPLCEAYQQSLADTELCLAPRGSRVWSPRLFEMIWFGCIPATQMHFGCYTWTSQLCWNAHSESQEHILILGAHEFAALRSTFNVRFLWQWNTMRQIGDII